MLQYAPKKITALAIAVMATLTLFSIVSAQPLSSTQTASISSEPAEDTPIIFQLMNKLNQNEFDTCVIAIKQLNTKKAYIFTESLVKMPSEQLHFFTKTLSELHFLTKLEPVFNAFNTLSNKQFEELISSFSAMPNANLSLFFGIFSQVSIDTSIEFVKLFSDFNQYQLSDFTSVVSKVESPHLKAFLDSLTAPYFISDDSDIMETLNFTVSFISTTLTLNTKQYNSFLNALLAMSPDSITQFISGLGKMETTKFKVFISGLNDYNTNQITALMNGFNTLSADQINYLFLEMNALEKNKMNLFVKMIGKLAPANIDRFMASLSYKNTDKIRILMKGLKELDAKQIRFLFKV